jgi:selenocysteine lyase/cysteine desulfurase
MPTTLPFPIDRVREGLAELPGITLYQAPAAARKTPTVAFTVRGVARETVCRTLLDRQSVFVASGDFYATTLADKLAVNPAGWVRAGLSPYNTEAEADRFIAGITGLAR